MREKSSLHENLKRIQEQISQAASKSGRKPEDITLVAATKTIPPDIMNQVISAGVTHIGENRVQEYLEKKDDLLPCTRHIIGTLQTNKVKYVVGQADLIQSVNSLKLAAEIDRVSRQRGVVSNVLVEINAGQEAAKTGLNPDMVLPLLEEMSRFSGLSVQGLMAIGPFFEKKEEIRPFFHNVQKLFLDIEGKKIDNVTMGTLSMGMSGDYDIAIEEGATMIRVGSALFGARTY